KGSLPFDLLLAAQKRLPARMVNDGLDGLKNELRSRRPVIACINRLAEWLPADHYIVVVGYDEARAGIYAHSGLHANVFIPYRKFLRVWKKIDYWALYVSSAAAKSPA